MKKIVSLALAALLVFAAIACCFSASAAGTDPSFTADKSILNKSGKFYSNHLENQSKMFDHNYGTLVDYGGKTVVYSSGVANEETEVTFINKGLWANASAAQWGADNQPVNINGVVTSNGFVTIQGGVLADGKTAKSFLVAVPANEELANTLFEGFTIFSGTEEWDERNGYNVPLATANNKTFTEVAKVDKIDWKLSADGTFKYFEANFAAPVAGPYLQIAFTAENLAGAFKAFNEGKLGAKVLFPVSEFAAFEEEIAAPADYLMETAPAGKTDILNGVTATYSATKNNGLTTDLLTDGIIAVHKAPAGEVEEKYFNKAYGDSGETAALEFAGVDTKALYAFSFDGLNGAKVDSFQVVYGAQNGSPFAGRSYNMDHADVQIMFLVSTDNGTTWQKAYISNLIEGSNVIKSSAVTGGTLTAVDDENYCYYTIDITLDKTYENVTNIVLASPLGRTQINGWASRIMEVSAFGEKGAAPATTEAQTTEAPEVTTAPEATTEAPTTDAPTTEAPEEKKGCGSVAAIGVAVIVTVLGTAVLRKKD